MSERITMNSKSLQEKFPEVYRELFSRCSIVTSCVTTFLWVGEYACQEGGIAILNKVPRRIYIGIENISQENSIEFGTAYHFFSDQQKFIKSNISLNLSEKKYLNFLRNEIIKIHNNFPGFRIHIISEIKDTYYNLILAPLNVSLIISSLLFLKIINNEDIIHLKKLKYSEYENNHLFRKVFSLIHKTQCCGYGNYSANSASWELLDYDFPLIEFHETKINLDGRGTIEIPANISGLYQLLDKIKTFFARLNDFGDVDNNPLNYLDFGYICSGKHYRADAVMKQINYYNNNFEKSFFMVINKLKKIVSVNFQKNSIYCSFFENKKQVNIWDRQIELLNYLGLETIASFFHAGQSGKIDQLLDSIKNYRQFYPVLNEEMEGTKRICGVVEEYAMKKWGEKIALKPTGAGVGGNLVFVSPAGVLRHGKIEELIKYLQKNVDKNIFLEYASWIDGIEEEGVKLEQHLAEGIRSKFISKGSVLIKSYDKTNIYSKVLSLEQFEKEKQKTDLTIDLENKNIFIKGQKLTSKDVHSSTVTVEILKTLLENQGKKVSNKDLPESSYTLERGELQSKIVTPLVKAVKKYANKKLDLKITGSLTNFWVELTLDDLEVVLVEKII